jgi:GalNAc-alpha-(1->4)-GalNAc-alpha-(1->3)-diNAcBac-PP-undecaprenol alpha-1,4-N-acetyl-D-galactosaminyltransferase
MGRIVIAVHSLQVGGMERVTSELANSFINKGNNEVHIILYGINRDIFYILNSNIIIHRPSFPFNNNNRTASTIKTIFFLRKKINELHPDTVLSFGEYWNNLVLLATLGMKIPIFVADRSTPLKNLGKVQNSLRKYLYPKAEGLIVQTFKANVMYKRKFKNLQIKTIGNPISQIDIQNDLVKENIILSVGRLIETKHHDNLIHIFSKLKASDWKMVIVGGNAKKQKNDIKLLHLIKDLDLEDQVILAGNQKDVLSYYLKSKIFAFTSSSEGFPNVIGEAMSAGLPVIAYDCMAGPSEMITDGQDGFIIPLFDDALYQQKLQFLMNNDVTRNKMGLKAAWNIKKYNSDTIAEQFLKVILP